MLFHPFQLFTIAIMFCPGLWVAPPRPPDAPPPSRRATIGYKIVAGFALSHVYWLIPTTDHCNPDSLCSMFHESQSLLALPAPGPISPRSPAPTSRPYISSLLRTSCPVVVIPPRPAPTCRNAHVHPAFEWAPQSPAPSLVLAQRSCSPSSLPMFPGDEYTYVHPFISPFSPPRPTDAAPIHSVLLLVTCIICRKSLGNILAIVLVALKDLAKFIIRVRATRRSWRFKNVKHAARVLSGFVALGIIVSCYVVRGLGANYAVFSAFVLGLTVETILAWTKEVVSDMNMTWTSLAVVQKYTSVVSSIWSSVVPVLNDIAVYVYSSSRIPQLFVFDMDMTKVFAQEAIATFAPKNPVESISPTETNFESSNIYLTPVEDQAPVVQVVDGGKDEIVIAPLSPPTVLPISPPVTPHPSATEDDTVSGPREEDPVLESNLEPTLTVDDTLQDASESNSKSPTVELPVVEVPDDPEQLLEPLLASFVIAIPVSDVQSIHDRVTPASVPKEDSPPVASHVTVTTPIIDVEVLVDEKALVPQPEPESLSAPSPVFVTPAANGKVVLDPDYEVSTPVPEQERESGPSPEDALQREILTPVVDEVCSEEVLATPEPSLAKYNIVPDGATYLEDAFESKQQEIPEPLPAIDYGLSDDSPIRPGSPTTGNSMTELPPCSPLPVPSLEPLEASTSEYTSDSTYLPRIRRRVRRSVKRERKAERDAAEAVAVATPQVSTQYIHDLDTPDWCLVVRGKSHNRR